MRIGTETGTYYNKKLKGVILLLAKTEFISIT
jgi:hypothetical protein